MATTALIAFLISKTARRAKSKAIWRWIAGRPTPVLQLELEKRRLLYNLMLVLPALFGYFTATELPIAVGDRSHLGLLGTGVLFLLAALAANVCYSMCYSLEFVFGSDESSSAWLRSGRRVTLIAGIIFAMLLSTVGGRNIGLLEYQMRRALVNHPAAANSATAVVAQVAEYWRGVAGRDRWATPHHHT